MRVASEIHVEWVDDEAVALNPDTGQVHYLNPTAALVYALFLEHGVADGLAKLRETYGADRVAEDLDSLIEDMHVRGLLIDD